MKNTRPELRWTQQRGICSVYSGLAEGSSSAPAPDLQHLTEQIYLHNLFVLRESAHSKSDNFFKTLQNY